MTRRRQLRPEEQELWQVVARTAQPMHPQLNHTPTLDLPIITARPKPAEEALLPAFSIGEKARALPAFDLSASTPTSPLRMDAKAFSRMKRGKLSPEARIDLHGLTLAEAMPELVSFILNAHSNGLRLVLVITGKGKRGDGDGPIPQRPGVLRHQVPHWLSRPPLSAAVLQVTEAHLRHGGAGALYVYLRRRG
ncbi:MAG: DNA mismatch repair protein MutS [Cereibacter sphaeroides]|uniref:DNA mismatch repair protein MutS n=1 Tax=Cereibacter sphaeroides TaxID=1063 RepID=A0A2W5S6Y6_CERSP|nr:MAG: DNA mismatch repair protein MutS [Cereibacter sphaeroides]